MSDGTDGGADGVVGRDLRFGVLKPVYGAAQDPWVTWMVIMFIGLEAGRLATE